MGLQQTSEKTMGKNIFIWGIFCVLSAVLFSSCNKEDEEIDNDYTESVTKKQKHLVSSTFYSTDELTNTTYIYDSTGKLIKMSLYNDGNEYDSFNISDTITLDHKGDIVFYISKFDSDGFIAIDSMIWKNVSDNAVTHTVARIFRYDENGHLVYSESNDSNEEEPKETYEWIWEDGNIINFKSSPIKKSQDNYSYEINWLFKYTNDEVTTPIANKTDILFTCYSSETFILNYCNRHGVPCKDLPVSIFNEKRGSEQRIKWSLDSDGYPIKAERYYFTDGKPSKIISTQEFIWE